MPTSGLNKASHQRGGPTPKPPGTARSYHDMMSSLQNNDAAIIEQPREPFGFEASLQEEVAARHRAETNFGDRCDKLEMSLLALYSHCIPEGGEATTLSERLGNLEATVKATPLSYDLLEAKVKGSQDELNTQLETLRHAHAGLAGVVESSRGQQESLMHCYSVFSREFEVAKQAQSSHASLLSDLGNVNKELSGTMAVANINIAACRKQTSALEDHIVALMEQNASLERSIEMLVDSNNRSSAKSSPRTLSAIEERLAAIERAQAFLPSAAEERLSAIEKEYTSLPSAFGAIDKRLTVIEKEHCALTHCHLTLSPFETEPVQSPIPSQTSTTVQIAEACLFSAGSEDSSEGIESVQAASMAARNDVEGASPNQPLKDRQQKGCVAEDADPRIIVQQNFAVAMNILKTACQKRQDEQQPAFLNVSARVVKGIVSCFPVTS